MARPRAHGPPSPADALRSATPIRVELDGTWRFQLLARAGRRARRGVERDPRSRAAGRCRASTTCPSTRTSRCRSRACRRTSPSDNPTGVYEREFELPERLGGPAGRAPRRRRGERPDRPRQRRGRRAQQGLPPRRRVRRHRPRQAGPEHADAPGREVVRRDVHRGPGPVVARRDHPVGVPVLDRAGLPRRHPGDRRAGRRPPDRHARPRRAASASPAIEPASRLDGRGAARGRRRADVDVRAEAPSGGDSTGSWKGPEAEQLVDRTILGDDGRRPSRERWADALPPPRAAARGRRRVAARGPGVEPWSAEVPTLYPLVDPPRSPDRRGRRGGRAAGRLPAGRDPRRRPARQRAAGPASAASTATTSTSTPGASCRPRVDARRPRPDEAVQLQRRAHLALPQRPGASSTWPTSSGCT